jgi:hypothetical protein
MLHSLSLLLLHTAAKHEEQTLALAWNFNFNFTDKTATATATDSKPNPMKSSEVKWSEVVGLVVAELKGIWAVSVRHLIRFSCHEPNTAGIWSASDGIFFVAIGMF